MTGLIMATLGIYEARTRWSEMIDRVGKGEEITITRHGTPVAKLVPADGRAKVAVAEAVEELRKFRRKHKLRGLTIKQMIGEGRRY
jgi:prevent-host-death family protein